MSGPVFLEIKPGNIPGVTVALCNDVIGTKMPAHLEWLQMVQKIRWIICVCVKAR